MRRDCNQRSHRKRPHSVVSAYISIRIPRHSSILSHPQVQNELLRTDHESRTTSEISMPMRNAECFRSENEACDPFSRKDQLPHFSFYVQCYHPGVLWRGLFPLIDTPQQPELFGENRFMSLSRKGSHDNVVVSATANDSNLICAELVGKIMLQLGLEDALNQEISSMGEYMTKTEFVSKNASETEYEKWEGDNSYISGMFFERMISLPLDLSRSLGENQSQYHCDPTLLPSPFRNPFHICLYLLPPLMSPSDFDRTGFASIALRIQRNVLFQKGLSAWFSTLGGGYFGVKDLPQSLRLSRQQRLLALQVGDIQMARQCTINEAYNWMYAGRFKVAASILRNLEAELTVIRSSTYNVSSPRNRTTGSRSQNFARNPISAVGDEKVLQQCITARQCLRRLKKLSLMGLEKYDKKNVSTSALKGNYASLTIDDFQRVRIVSF